MIRFHDVCKSYGVGNVQVRALRGVEWRGANNAAGEGRHLHCPGSRGVEPGVSASPVVLLSDQTVARLGLTTKSEESVLFQRAMPPDTQAEDLARTILLSDTARAGELVVERGDPRPDRIARVNQIAGAAIVAVSLAVVGTGVTLSTGELCDEFAVLYVVGGDGTVRRRVAACRTRPDGR